MANHYFLVKIRFVVFETARAPVRQAFQPVVSRQRKKVQRPYNRLSSLSLRGNEEKRCNFGRNQYRLAPVTRVSGPLMEQAGKPVLRRTKRQVFRIRSNKKKPGCKTGLLR